jgi:4-alpha-glucanotransferase
MDRIFERAACWGIETQYHDGFGRPQTVTPDVLVRLLGVIAPDAERPPRMLPQTVVVREGGDRTIRLAGVGGLPLQWEIHSGRLVAEGNDVAPLLNLPQGLPTGTFDLRLTATTPLGISTEAATLIVCPRHAYQGGPSAPARMWALAVQLYGIRSARNWGHGDFTDLLALVELAAELGAAGIGLNPLHALFDDRPSEPSPYFPSSRLFLNPLYIDLDAVPEFSGARDAGLEGTIELLRGAGRVHYAAVAEAKARALRLAYAEFNRSGTARRRDAFERFRDERGATLARFACFEVMRRKLDGPWWQWPAPWHRPGDQAIDALRASEEVGFVEYVQWLAHDQLDRCRARARELGLAIGLYLDVAVGVRRDGFDAWCDQDAIMTGMAIGAPPDALNRSGQDWGLAAFNPVALEHRQFEPFRRMLAASMQYAGAIRLDHVLGLQRLFLVPDGLSAAHGTYIRCPFEALLAVTTLASNEGRCIVVGEDLGTVPERFRETLADWGLWSYQVMLFERAGDGTFRPPESFREHALVTFATHDLPTYAGWRQKQDIAIKQALGHDPGETDDERQRVFDALSHALRGRGLATEGFAPVARYLADAPSRLLVVSIEDLLGVTDQVNLPGTIDAYPNWRHRLPIALEDLRRHDGVIAVADAMRSAGRNSSPEHSR